MKSQHSNLVNLSRCQPLLGTYVSIDLAADLDFEELARISSLGYEAIATVQDLMSYHDPDSELSLVNSLAHITPVPLHPHTEKVISFALEMAEKTDGIFDPTIAPQLVDQDLLPSHQETLTDPSSWKNVSITNHKISFTQPTHIDLGGIAKGYAVDLATTVIREEFLKLNIDDPHITINAGGDLTESHWLDDDKLLDIRHPQTGIPFKQIKMLNTAVATSAYCFQEKGKRPIIDPRIKEPLNLTKSISIFSPSCMASDALTKVYALAPDSTIHTDYHATPIIL